MATAFAIFSLLALAMSINGSPLLNENNEDDVVSPTTHCIYTQNSAGANCSVCYDTSCPIDDEQILASFSNSSLHDLLFGTTNRKSRSIDYESISPLGPSRCIPMAPPVEEAEAGCAYIAKIGKDGCLQCYSKSCLQCNNTESTENNSLEISDQVYHAGLQLTGSTGMTFSQTVVSCPPVHPNQTAPAGCLNVPYRGTNGCIQFYTLVCPSTSFSIEPVTTPQPTAKCPKVKPPVGKPMPGCVRTKNVDSNGCVISYDTICSKPIHRPAKPMNEIEPIAGNNLDWRSMLASYRGPGLRDPRKFRPRASLAIPSSGKFVPCKRQPDCFQYREPKEWCMPRAQNGTYAWTDKSCYCAYDTERRTCLIERVNFRTKEVEWTFCSPKKDHSCL